MFDFLRNLRDEVVAEVSLMGCVNKSLDEGNNDSIIFKSCYNEMEEIEYIKAMDFKYASLFPNRMRMIKEKGLVGLDPETIHKKLDNKSISVDAIRNVLRAYSLIAFFKEKGFSPSEVSDIIKVANIWEANADKSISDIAVLANCSEDSVESVIKMIGEVNSRTVKNKPFTMENATPNSGQKPIVQSPAKPTTKTPSKKGATATA